MRHNVGLCISLNSGHGGEMYDVVICQKQIIKTHRKSVINSLYFQKMMHSMLPMSRINRATLRHSVLPWSRWAH